MADFNLGVSLAGVTSGMDSMYQFFVWLFTMLVLGGALWFLMWYMSFKHKVRIRQQTNSGYYVIDTWARQYKNRRTGIVKWRILKPAQHVAPPPEGYVEITVKGRFSSECDRSIDGTIVWRRIARNAGEVDVFTAEERTMVIHELREAESYKKKSWGELALAIAPMLMLVMILVIFMIFFKETVQPTIDLNQATISLAERIESSAQRFEAVCLDRPRLQSQNNSLIPN